MTWGMIPGGIVGRPMGTGFPVDCAAERRWLGVEVDVKGDRGGVLSSMASGDASAGGSMGSSVSSSLFASSGTCC